MVLAAILNNIVAVVDDAHLLAFVAAFKHHFLQLHPQINANNNT
jgi:hypothetical protein